MSARAELPSTPRIGTAGWSIPKQHAAAFPASGSHLERYARRFNAVEINSSFYRPHRRATYERWAAAVPENFVFAVKAPRALTHDARLIGAESALDRFLDEASGLGGKLGPLLFQLPPGFAFDVRKTRAFLKTLRARHAGAVVWEPRHATWFTPPADSLLAEYRVARVAADPAFVPAAAAPGGWDGLQYFRLHGAPRIYYSDYAADDIARYAQRMSAKSWCIFDNTALGAATANALALAQALG
jgi:uncharacterized protein YecE (DUF72 family)